MENWKQLSQEKGNFHEITLSSIIPNNERKRFSKSVIDEADKIKIREYSSSRPGDLIFITGGQHGEETKDFTSIESIENNLSEVKKGTIVFIPELNPSGCKEKRRYVFDDEPDTNLNNEYHHFKTGSWYELKDIKDNKTAQLSWMVMRYLKQKTKEHKKTNSKSISMLIDIHREESIPFIRIDRKFTDNPNEQEDNQRLEELLNLYRKMGLPIVLEKATDWEKDAFYQSLTASTIRNNILGITIEEGNTHSPEKNNSDFLIAKLLVFLRNQGFIETFSDLPESRVDLPPISNAVEVWQRQLETGEVYSLTGAIRPLVKTGNKYKDIGSYMREVIYEKKWDGFFTVYLAPTRGELINRSEKKYTELGTIKIGYETDYVSMASEMGIPISIKSRSKDFFVVDMVEPKEKGERLIHLGYFMDTDGKVILRAIGERSGKKVFAKENALKPDEIRKLKDQEIKFDNSVLYLYCASLDPVWEGTDIGDGQISLQKRHLV